MPSRRPIALAAALAALCLTSPARAKEIEQVKACGSGGCRTVSSVGADAHRLIPSAGAPQLVPFYKLRIGIGDGSGKVLDTLKVLWAPRIGMIANDEAAPQWFPADVATQRLARRLTRGLRPYAASDMPIALPEARVDETVTPAAGDGSAAPAGGGGGAGGGPPWAILGVVGVVAAGAAALLRRRTPRLG